MLLVLFEATQLPYLYSTSRSPHRVFGPLRLSHMVACLQADKLNAEFTLPKGVWRIYQPFSTGRFLSSANKEQAGLIHYMYTIYHNVADATCMRSTKQGETTFSSIAFLTSRI